MRPRLVQVVPFDPPEIYIDIVTVGSNSRVVTTIELLSPVNKQPGEGREQYLAKQRQTLASHTHLIEIDLLRAGPPAIACGRPCLCGRAALRLSGVPASNRTGGFV